MPPSSSRPKSKARIAAYRGGHRGETLAAWYLRLKFYRIIGRRYKTPLGEIDLIAERFGTIAFVEVKARSKVSAEIETLEGIRQDRITRAAQSWLAHNPRHAKANLRFDVIFLAPGHWPRHISNAFDASP